MRLPAPYSRTGILLYAIPLYGGPLLAGLSAAPLAILPVLAAMFGVLALQGRMPDLSRGRGWADLLYLLLVQAALVGLFYITGACVAWSLGPLPLPVWLPLLMTFAAAAFAAWRYRTAARLDDLPDDALIDLETAASAAVDAVLEGAGTETADDDAAAWAETEAKAKAKAKAKAAAKAKARAEAEAAALAQTEAEADAAAKAKAKAEAKAKAKAKARAEAEAAALAEAEHAAAMAKSVDALVQALVEADPQKAMSHVLSEMDNGKRAVDLAAMRYLLLPEARAAAIRDGRLGRALTLGLTSEYEGVRCQARDLTHALIADNANAAAFPAPDRLSAIAKEFPDTAEATIAIASHLADRA